jgi:hypothetical protein
MLRVGFFAAKQGQHRWQKQQSVRPAQQHGQKQGFEKDPKHVTFGKANDHHRHHRRQHGVEHRRTNAFQRGNGTFGPGAWKKQRGGGERVVVLGKSTLVTIVVKVGREKLIGKSKQKETMLLTGRFDKHVRNVGRIIHRQPDTDQNVNGRDATDGNVPVKHKPDQIHHGQDNRQNDPRCNAPMRNQTRNHHTDHGPTDRQIADQFFVDDAHFFPVQEFKRIRKRFGPSVVFHHFGQFFAHGGLQDMFEKSKKTPKQWK